MCHQYVIFPEKIINVIWLVVYFHSSGMKINDTYLIIIPSIFAWHCRVVEYPLSFLLPVRISFPKPLRKNQTPNPKPQTLNPKPQTPKKILVDRPTGGKFGQGFTCAYVLVIIDFQNKYL